MKTTREFLLDVKTRHHLTSDGQLAKLLGLTRASASVFMLGKNYLGDETAIKVAELLEIDPAHVVACVHAERAKHEGERKLWERIAKLTAGATVLLFLFAIFPFDPSITGGPMLAFAGFTVTKSSTLYIMSNEVIKMHSRIYSHV